MKSSHRYTEKKYSDFFRDGIAEMLAVLGPDDVVSNVLYTWHYMPFHLTYNINGTIVLRTIDTCCIAKTTSIWVLL